MKKNHNTCNFNFQGRACPECKGKLTDTRCLMVERMLNRLPKPECVFPECSFKRTDHQAVLDHQEDCMHRKAPCGKCGESMAMSSLNNHLEAQHGQHEGRVGTLVPWGALSKILSFGIYVQRRLEVLQEPDNTSLWDVTFYFNSMPVNDTNIMTWLSYNGSRKDAQKYKFTIEVLDEEKEETVLSCTRFCVPCDTSWDDVKEENLGVTVNKKLAQQVNLETNPENEPRFNITVDVFLAR